MYDRRSYVPKKKTLGEVDIVPVFLSFSNLNQLGNNTSKKSLINVFGESTQNFEIFAETCPMEIPTYSKA